MKAAQLNGRALTNGGSPSREQASPVSTPAPSKARFSIGATISYLGVLLFVIVYCVRPNDWVPGMMFFPFAKIPAVVAIVGLLIYLLESGGLKNMPPEMRYLALLFGQLSICVPFSTWVGGSYTTVFEEFSKVVVITLCTAISLTTIKRLRSVLIAQTGLVAGMAILAAAGKGKVLVDGAGQVRMVGIVGGIFENPNDFAFAMALVFPIAIYFGMRTRNPLMKVIWFGSVITMAYCVIRTLSRGGLLALVTAVGIILWQIGVKEKRRSLLVLTVVGALAMVLASPGQFFSRVASIVNISKDATGSAFARRDLLMTGLGITLKNPLFGIGPGNFPVYSGNWHGAHNTYVQLSAEAGVLAAVLFILIVVRSFRNLRQAKTWTNDVKEMRDLSSALSATLGSYAVGALFGDTAYHFFPYLLFGFISAYCKLAKQYAPTDSPSGQGSPGRAQTWKGSARVGNQIV